MDLSTTSTRESTASTTPRLRRWLTRARRHDELERRQARILQAILVALAIVFLVAGISSLLRELPPGMQRSFPTNLVGAAVVAALILVLRRGYLRIVAALFVVLLVIAFGGAMAVAPTGQGAGYLPLLLFPLVVAGLLLPRWALLLTAVAVYAAGQFAAQDRVGASLSDLRPSLGNFLFAIILVTVAVDRFGGAVREALGRAVEHERALEAGRTALAQRSEELQAAVASLQAEIAERQRLEGEGAAMREQIAQGQRLESIGRLAGGVAHDFNNLLTAIRGYADLADADAAAGEDVRDDLQGIRQAADQAAALTRQLLAFSRNQELRPTVVDLDELVGGIEPLLRRLLGEHIRIVFRQAGDLWPVLIDQARIESVLVNLAVNARDAMPDGGTLTIQTANVQLDEGYARAHDEVAPGEYVMLAVSDTGEGMDASTLAHIFEPFFTTKDQGKGTGLGLASAYGTVRQSGGHIWVYSEVGHGTMFKVYLPRTDSTAPVAAPRPARAAAGGHELVLVAEDEVFVREMVVDALRQRGYTVIAVPTGQAALEVLAGDDRPIAVLLTDAVMPGMTGLELIDAARARRPDLPAILMSGYTAQTVDERGLAEDIGFLEKPFTLVALEDAIRGALAR